MDTDKNHNILEKQLKTLGQKVRIDILKKLKNTQTPLSFSGIQKEVLGNELSSVNLSFHLNTLKKSKLIDSSEEGYTITILGAQIIDKILSIEEILDQQNQTRMIRTSKYSKEIFDTNKIEEYLVMEGEIEQYLARKIAREVEERLSKTNIEYLTAPLMREYINAILLENGLEEVRHKLTR
ncbi:MAG: ArsR/SmtB family transcription factor, partial [Candidatus Thorarchaeota archaeon]